MEIVLDGELTTLNMKVEARTATSMNESRVFIHLALLSARFEFFSRLIRPKCCLSVQSGWSRYNIACLFDNARVLLRNSLIKFDLTKHQ